MKKLRCLKCGKEWTPRIDKPEQCPRCKSYNWKISEADKIKAHIKKLEEVKGKND